MSNDKDTKKLTLRQKNLLFTVIKEYCDSGQTIGSKEIKQKYNFNFSSATIRAEFAKLREMDYLYQPFTNASSQPTEKALKLFINQLIHGIQVTNVRQRELQKEIFRMQKKQTILDKEISRLLALQAGSVGFSVSSDRESYSGIKNLLSSPTQGKVSDILDFLDNLDHYKKPLLENNEYLDAQVEIIDTQTINSEKQDVFIDPKNTKQTKKNKIKTFFGSENPIIPLGKGFAMVSAEINIDKEKSVVGLIAPIHLLAKEKNLELVQALQKAIEKQNEK